MVRSGDADGMVSGAQCTTANTIRPALQVRRRAGEGRGHGAAPPRAAVAGTYMRPAVSPNPPPSSQVLKTPQKTLVSSIFFMCLPDKVGVCLCGAVHVWAGLWRCSRASRPA